MHLRKPARLRRQQMKRLRHDGPRRAEGNEEDGNSGKGQKS
jgi:hypothetical protein